MMSADSGAMGAGSGVVDVDGTCESSFPRVINEVSTWTSGTSNIVSEKRIQKNKDILVSFKDGRK